MKKHWKLSLLLLACPMASCATPLTSVQIAQWKVAAQTMIFVLRTAEKLSPLEAEGLSELIDAGQFEASAVVVHALADAGKLTVPEARGILGLLELIQATLIRGTGNSRE